MSEAWKTAVTQVRPNELRLRGYCIDELMGQASFAQVVYLAIKGELPSPAVGKLMDAMLVSTIDHGVTPPSTQAARVAISTGAPLNAAIAAGVLAVNKHHGGAIYDCMSILEELIRRSAESRLPVAAVAATMVSEYQAARQKLAGFGHRVHTADPRTARLLRLADELGLAGNGVAAARAIEAVFAASGKPLPMSVDGALAALLIDLDLPQELANAFFIMARVPGLVAHIHEEQTRETPMRRINPLAAEYDGPGERCVGV